MYLMSNTENRKSKNSGFFSSISSTIKHGPTLQITILVAFASLLVATVLIIIGYTYRQNTTAVLNISEQLINQATDTVMERTTSHLSPAALLAQTSANIPNLNPANITTNEELEAYGMELLRLYPQLSGFFIGNEEGDFLFTKRFPDSSIGTQIIERNGISSTRTWTYRDPDDNVTEVEVTPGVDYDPRLRPWYEGAAASGDQFWTDIYIFFTDQKPGITAAYPIMDASGKTVAVVGIDVALEELSRFLEAQEVGQNGLVFIVNSKGEIVAFPGGNLAMAEGDSFRPMQVTEMKNQAIVDAFAEFEDVGNGRFTIDSSGQRYIGSFTPFPNEFGKDWQIGIVVPEADFIGTIQRTNQISFLMSLAILLLAVAVAVFVARSISRPIELLTEETARIKNFELDQETAVHSSIREVAELSQAITSMKAGLNTFQKYVPADLVRQLIQTGEGAKLGGQKRELSVMFTDIAGFTTITEGADAEVLMEQLSSYLGEVATIILENNGAVDKFTGDGMLAFWGAPLDNPNHARDACKAAIYCRDRVAELNEAWQENGRYVFPTRISVTTGEALIGNMGSPQRMNYTLLGDNVNLGSRLEAANKIYGTQIIVNHETFLQANDLFHFRPLDYVRVRGKTENILIYELVGEVGKIPTETADFLEQFTQAFAYYMAHQYDAALQIFASLLENHLDDNVLQMYMMRCSALQKHPPEDGLTPTVDLESVQSDSILLE